MSDKQVNAENESQEAQEYADLIARLRTEKDQTQQRDYEAGYEHGVFYAQEMASYDEFVILKQIKREAMEDRRFSVGYLIVSSTMLVDTRDYVWQCMRDIGAIDAEAFWNGWLAGVMSIWAKVKHAV